MTADRFVRGADWCFMLAQLGAAGVHVWEERRHSSPRQDARAEARRAEGRERDGGHRGEPIVPGGASRRIRSGGIARETGRHHGDLLGEITMVYGGTVVDGKTTAPGEIRGPSIKGGTEVKLGAGDVLHIPAKVAHRMNLDPGARVTYFVTNSLSRSERPAFAKASAMLAVALRGGGARERVLQSDSFPNAVNNLTLCRVTTYRGTTWRHTTERPLEPGPQDSVALDARGLPRPPLARGRPEARLSDPQRSRRPHRRRGPAQYRHALRHRQATPRRGPDPRESTLGSTDCRRAYKLTRTSVVGSRTPRPSGCATC